MNLEKIKILLAFAEAYELERYVIVVDTRQPAAYLRENLCTHHKWVEGEVEYTTKPIKGVPGIKL